MDRSDRRFPTAMNRQTHSSTTITIILVAIQAFAETNVQIRTSAEHPTMARKNNAFHAAIEIEEFEDGFEFAHERACEGIVVFRSV